MIREYDPGTDYGELRRLLVALQDHEREIDPRMPDGESIADDYLREMFERCDEHDGLLLVEESEGRLTGYVTVLVGMVSEELEDGREPYALVSDIMVDRSRRGTGIGAQLMKRAIDYARAREMPCIRLSVMADNCGSHDFYRKFGFRDLYIDMEMRLTPAD